MGWRLSWSYDMDRLNKISFHHPLEVPYEIRLRMAQWFLKRRCSKSMDDGRIDEDDGRTDERTDGR